MFKHALVQLALIASLLVWTGCGSSKSNSSDVPTFAELLAQAEADPDAESRARRLIELGRKQTSGQDRTGAEEAFDRASTSIASVDDPLSRSHLYLDLCKALLQLDSPVAARSAVQNAGKAAAEIDDKAQRAEVLAALAAQQLATGNRSAAAKSLDEAELTARELGPSEEAVRALAGVAVVYQVRMGVSDESRRVLGAARRLADEIEDLSPRTRALATLAYGAHRCGQFGDAEQTFEAAIAAARQIESPYTRAFALATLAGEALKVDRKPLAKSLLDETQQIVPQIPEADLQQQIREKLRPLQAKV